ncbi:DUF342 domain-containing protein [Effusibacillus dendaii]|uniref:Polymerase n=1 Tax=Effusibacillus dendaii TaxID=2743772 RepID=A0A7I8D591_9BACL|nr:FapA family protein [Effusibacillus dendaii]BCJ85288.1 polymerase [Effusibacillus dendaii]
MEGMEEKSWWIKNCKVFLEEQGLYGTLLIEKEPPADIQLTIEGLLDFLKNAGILLGIDMALCQQIVSDPAAHIQQRLRIAVGKPAEKGQDAIIEIYIEEDGQRTPKVLETGKVDYFDMGSVNTVKQGAVLAKRIPPQPGVDGMAVSGQPIIAKQGRDYRLPQGKNTKVDEDGCTLLAETDGHVVFIQRENKINIFNEYVVQKDVDFSVGNIEFSGSVRILGNVQPGFRIKAEGDVEIQGYVDAATVEADGNVTIRGGVQGRNKGFIRSGGNLRTPFIQNASISVEGSCYVGESIMHSQVSAGAKVIMEGRKGVIVGGIVRAGEEVVTKVLGSQMATPTELEVGVHPHLRAELASINEKMKELIKNVDKTQKAVDLLENMNAGGHNLPPDKAALLQKLKLTLNHYKLEGEELMFRRSEIEMVLQDLKSARVNVFDTVHPGVKIMLSNYIYFVRDSLSHVSFVIRDAEVRTVPL